MDEDEARDLVSARKRLFNLARRSAVVREETPEHWELQVRKHAPHLVAEVGEQGLKAIIALAWDKDEWIE